MAATYDYTWSQGEDKTISLTYRSGPAGAETPVDLTSYSFRMDIVAPDGKRVAVMNNAALEDVDPYTTGAQADAITEVTLGADGSIEIVIPRSLTLPNGALHSYLSASPPINVFSYDMFLRTAAGIQTKIMQGTMTIERSVTNWT